MDQVRAANRLRDPVRRTEAATDLMQIIKCRLAATVAWWLSVNVLDSPLPFLAPWTESVAHLRHLVRTLHESTYSHGTWDEQFRARWSSIVRDTGRAVADPEASPDPVRARLGSLTRAMADDSGLPRDYWPVYGSLVTVISHVSSLIGAPTRDV